MKTYTIVAVEPQDDGFDHVFTSEYCKKMKLPFKHGWDHWQVRQGDYVVFSSRSYAEARRTASALNAIQLKTAA